MHGLAPSPAARFSIRRAMAIALKEYHQVRRDPFDLLLIIGLPLMQLVLCGYAIQADPKQLPTGVVVHESSFYTRGFLEALRVSSYFDIQSFFPTREDGQKAIERGDLVFLVEFEDRFAERLVRGERPQILIESDFSDPLSTSRAVAFLEEINRRYWDRALRGSLDDLRPRPPPIDLVVHRAYNPEAVTQYFIVPGLVGVVLGMTLVNLTTIAIVRELERGTMEHLLTMPARPAEVIFGKTLPYTCVGYLQTLMILATAMLISDIPFEGSFLLLMAIALVYIIANLGVGLVFSTIARHQLQAIYLVWFFAMHSMLLSGFMFPFRGMPEWAQWIGEILPLTHFLRIIRGIMLKGADFASLWQETLPILLFGIVTLLIAQLRFRQTLE